jgi:hypothetical protein
VPYERTHSKLENLIAEALNYEEIQDGAAQTGLSESILRELLLHPSLEEKAPGIWDAGAQEIATYDQLENEYEVHVRQLRREEEWLRRSYLRSPKWALVVILVGVSPIFLLTCLLILLLALDQVGLLLSPVTFGSILSGSIFSSVGILTLTVILLFSIMVSLIYIAACRNLYQRYSVSKGRYESRLAEIQRQLGFAPFPRTICL